MFEQDELYEEKGGLTAKNRELDKTMKRMVIIGWKLSC